MKKTFRFTSLLVVSFLFISSSNALVAAGAGAAARSVAGSAARYSVASTRPVGLYSGPTYQRRPQASPQAQDVHRSRQLMYQSHPELTSQSRQNTRTSQSKPNPFNGTQNTQVKKRESKKYGPTRDEMFVDARKF